MARPKLDIKAEEVEKLAALGCKVVEIADLFNCTEQTIIARFQNELNKGRAELKKSLRRMQIEVAMKGNAIMLIWLGKQMLGQKELSKIELEHIPSEVLVEEAKKRLNAGTQRQGDSN